MAEYIEREKVYDMLNAFGGCGAIPDTWADGWDKAINTAIDKLNNIPAADVRPERHGRWEKFSENTWQCTECKKLFSAEWWYCPHCGAKMDGKEKL